MHSPFDLTNKAWEDRQSKGANISRNAAIGARVNNMTITHDQSNRPSQYY